MPIAAHCGPSLLLQGHFGAKKCPNCYLVHTLLNHLCQLSQAPKVLAKRCKNYTKFSHHMHQRQTDQCELITRRSQAVVFACASVHTQKILGQGDEKTAKRWLFVAWKNGLDGPARGRLPTYYFFLEIHKVCPEKWSDRMLLPNRLTAFRILFRWVTQREAEGPAKGSIGTHTYYLPTYIAMHCAPSGEQK